MMPAWRDTYLQLLHVAELSITQSSWDAIMIMLHMIS